MAEPQVDRLEKDGKPERWISGHLLIGILVILVAGGIWFRNRGEAHLPVSTTKGLRFDDEPPATQPTLVPSTVPATAPALADEVYTDVFVTSDDTAMVRSDGKGGAIYDSLKKGTSLTLLDDPAGRAPDELIRARTEAGVEGRIPAGRLKVDHYRQLVLETLPRPQAPPLPMAGLAALPAAPGNGVDRKKVQDAIESALKFLLAAQQADGSWESVNAPVAGAPAGSLTGGQWGFATGLAGEALLDADQPANGSSLKAATDWLLTSPLVGTYSVAARDGFLDRFGVRNPSLVSKAMRSVVSGDRDRLFAPLQGAGPGRGGYSYILNPPALNGGGNPPLAVVHDRLATAFAIRGMKSLERLDAAVPAVFWNVHRYAMGPEQSIAGGFARHGPVTRVDPESVVATVAGLAAIGITDLSDTSDGYKCNGSVFSIVTEAARQRLNKGPAFFVPAELEPGTPPILDNLIPMLITDIACAAGQKYVGKSSWYPMLATQLLKTQNGDGSWGVGGQPPEVKVVETALAVIALSEARAPIVMNKLVDDPLGKRDWSQRPFDVANFTDWFTRGAFPGAGNWQAVTLDNPNDLQDANVLFIGSGGNLKLAPKEVQALAQFIANGGTIVANADCGKLQFSKSFAFAANAILPAQAGRELPPTHPLFAAQNFKAAKWKVPPKVIGWTLGNRDAILLIPDADAGKAWATQSTMTRRELFELGANIVQYAGGPKAR